MTTQERSPRFGWGGLLAVALGVVVGVAAGAHWHEAIMGLLGVRPSVASTSAPAQLWTCGMHPQVIQDHPGDCPICHMKLTPLAGGSPQGAAPGGASPGVLIDPAMVQNMGVRTVKAMKGRLTQRVRASATIVEPESARTDINLRVSGWIRKLYADTEGMRVRKGDPLFELDSPDLRLAIGELIAATRAGGLNPGNGGSSLEGGGEPLIAAARMRLETLGVSPEQIEQFVGAEHAPATVTFTSPIDGIVVEKASAYTGSSVMSGQRVMGLADRSTMWVEGRVPEGLLGRVRVGQAATIEVDGLGARAIAGDVVFIHPNLDEGTRTGLVRVVVPNHEGTLRAGMFAVVAIDSGRTDEVTIVPREAVIDSGESQLVFVSVGGGRYEPRPVVVGASGDGGLVQIVSGVEPGEDVVASGQFLLDSESRLREAIAKFLGQGGGARSAPAAPVADHGDRVAAADARAPAALVDRVIAEYLAIAEPLGQEQPDTPPAKVDGLLGAVEALSEKAEGADAGRLIGDARQAVAAMRSQSTDAQRGLFRQVSTAVIAIVDAMPASEPVAASLYVAHCPMAKADWLQRSKDLANPYYAEDMKECGSIVRRVGEGPVPGKRGRP